MPQISQELYDALKVWNNALDMRTKAITSYQDGKITCEKYLEMINDEFRTKMALSRAWASEQAREKQVRQANQSTPNCPNTGEEKQDVR